MELTKQPETEMEYWDTIESLGGFAWQMNHDLADGRITDPKGGIAKDIVDARKISDRLVTELGEKFGVIHPKDCPRVESGQEKPPAPEGKIYYWDWYHKMKTESYQREYEGIICSACPFSEGVERMIATSGRIPCRLFQGSMSRLRAPHVCGMISWGGLTEEQLFLQIRTEKGEDALVAFKAKMEKLLSVAPAAT